MPEGFRSFAELLRPAYENAAAAQAPLPQPVAEPPAQPHGREEDVDAGRDVRLFHARLKDALDASLESLLDEIAAGVLGRELRLAPADVQRIVERALRQFAAEEPLRVRLHPDDAAVVCLDLPIKSDACLRRGDAIVELRAGSIDATLGVRFESLLADIAP